ncbi:hypothetical protein [Natronorubrum halophilum]|uniref:hypothetical protein n=1 Tax=Natronorubrum halophilum TaxID=1702106 RepID=UPI000EF67E1E|nr:hypothetical protein [Natronorubrum halophilum]
MSATFTDDDLEKTVENANGEVIGTVTAVDGETARVAPRAGILDSIRSTLSWGQSHEDTLEIHETAVYEISSESIRLDVESVDALEEEPSADSPSETGLESDHTAYREPRNEPAEETIEDPTRETAPEGGEMAAANDNAAERDDETGVADDIGAIDTADATGPAAEPGAVDDEETETTDGAATESIADAETDESVDRSGVQDTPMGDLPDEPATEPSDESATELPDEPATEPDEMDGGVDHDSDPAATSDGTDSSDGMTAGPPTDESDPVDELDHGVDIESAADAAEPDEGDEAEGPSGADDVAEKLDTGVDLESAAEPDDAKDLETSETEAMDLSDEFDFSVDIESVVEADSEAATDSRSEAETGSDSRPETKLDPDVDVDSSGAADSHPETELEDDVYAASATVDANSEIVPDVDVESAVDSDQRSEPETDPDTIAGRDSDAETGAETTAREVVPGDAAVADLAAGETTPDASESEESQDRDRSETPLSAALAAQRTAMANGQELIEQGLAVQQSAAREAFQTSLLVQRQGIEAAQNATQQYFDAVSALAEADAGELRGRQQSMNEAIAELEDAHGQLADEELSGRLADHLEQLREVRMQLDEGVEQGDERVTAVLERQVELLEECRRRLS